MPVAGRKQVTIFDVAAEAGVSYSTVSRAMNDDPHIKDETKAKIREVMERLGYQANFHARKLAGIRSRVIGVMVPDFGSGNSYLSEILQGIDAELQVAGYDMVLYTAHRQEAKEASYIGQVTGGLSDGVLLVLPHFFRNYFEDFTRRNFPFVMIDHCEKSASYPSVSAANWQGAFHATEYLIHLGHTRIGFITGWREMACVVDRLAGHQEALKMNHLPIDPQLVVEGTFHQVDGFNGARRLLELENPPTAIFATNDMMAIGAMDGIRSHGLRIPEDVSVIGFDDVPQANFAHPALTTVRQPLQQMGRVATQMLLELLTNPAYTGQKIELPTELIVRDSCCAPGRRT